MTEPLRLICQPWATVADLPEKRPALDDDMWDRLLVQASETLYALSGRQFTGQCESMVTVRRPRRREIVPGWPYGAHGMSSSWPGLTGLRGVAWAARSPLVARLPGRPVTEIVEATLAGEPLDVDVESAAAGLMRRADGREWPADESCELTYRHGLVPPVGGRLAAVTLAVEFGRAWSGDAKHRLPKRLESVTREQVSYSMLNGFDSLDRGLLGIFEVDSWLREINPGRMAAPPSVWSPDSARVRRKVRD